MGAIIVPKICALGSLIGECTKIPRGGAIFLAPSNSWLVLKTMQATV